MSADLRVAVRAVAPCADFIDADTRESIACQADDLRIAAETLANCDETAITAESARLMVRVIERGLAEIKHLIDTRDAAKRTAGS